MAAKAVSLIRQVASYSQRLPSRSTLVTGYFKVPKLIGEVRFGSLTCPCRLYTTSLRDVSVLYRDGLPVISLPLPSRQEHCDFTLKPITHTVGDFIQFIQNEDGGIDRVAIYTPEGNKVAKSTTIDILLRSAFTLKVNDISYNIDPPPIEGLTSTEDLYKYDDVKATLSQLYSTLNIEEYQLRKEQELIQKLEDLKTQLQPLEQKKLELEEASKKRTVMLSWLGLGLMGLQFGVLARLTWWEYSWDIMEPVTYFVTYGTTIAMYAYFVLTKQDYNFPEVKDRQHLLFFYKSANKKKLDVHRYNSLKNAVALAELDLDRLRDPLQLHLPIQQLQKKPQ